MLKAQLILESLQIGLSFDVSASSSHLNSFIFDEFVFN
jgi:hypothetical protein